MAKEFKFTQEVKDNWLKALKSGEYTQTKARLCNEDKTAFCCIGVFADINEELNIDTPHIVAETNPYTVLKRIFGNTLFQKIWTTNDDTFNPKKPDYSNVIPLIESLPVQE